MADDKNKGPPKLTILAGAKATTQQPTGMALADEAELRRLAPFQRELKALDLWQQGLEHLFEAEKALSLAAQHTQVEMAQRHGEVRGDNYAGMFFDALAAVQTARARISECKEATLRYATKLDNEQYRQMLRNPRRTRKTREDEDDDV